MLNYVAQLFDGTGANAPVAAQDRSLAGVVTTGATIGEDFWAIRLGGGKNGKEK
jgi:hypothetical protein